MRKIFDFEARFSLKKPSDFLYESLKDNGYPSPLSNQLKPLEIPKKKQVYLIKISFQNVKLKRKKRVVEDSSTFLSGFFVGCLFLTKAVKSI